MLIPYFKREVDVIKMAHNNDLVRNKLIKINNQGLMLKAIALNGLFKGIRCRKTI